MSIVEYDPWRAYDDVLVNWLTTIPLLKDKNGNTITPRPVFATPERPFGRTASSGSSAPDTDFREILTLPTPVISVTRMDPVFAHDRFVFQQWPQIRATYQGFLAGMNPRPYDIPYQIDVRCRFRQHANFIHNFFAFAYQPMHVFIIDFGEPWNLKRVHYQLMSIVDNTDLDVQEEERWVRHTYTLIAHGNLFLPLNLAEIAGPGAVDPYGVYTNIGRVQRVVISWEFAEDIVDDKNFVPPAVRETIANPATPVEIETITSTTDTVTEV